MKFIGRKYYLENLNEQYKKKMGELQFFMGEEELEKVLITKDGVTKSLVEKKYFNQILNIKDIFKKFFIQAVDTSKL